MARNRGRTFGPRFNGSGNQGNRRDSCAGPGFASNSNPNPQPTRGVRLADGETLISDQFNNRVVAVTHAGKIVFQQGETNVAGDGFNQLNGPYDAKQIGDFTGLTQPF